MGTPTGTAAAGRSSFALVAGVVVLALHLPCLGWGFLADDYGHQVILEGLAEHPSMKPWNLYAFGELPPADTELFERVSPAWWTSPDWKVSFFRPVTSLSLWLDSALFGTNAVGYHATGLVLYAVLLGLVFALFRELGLSRGVATLGLAFFGLEAGSFLVVGWVANRNALLEALFAIAAVLVLARASRRRARAAGLSAALLLALGAALCKESGVSAFALVAAYLLLHRRREAPAAGDESGALDPGFVRAGVALSLALAAGYLVFLAAAGYGARTPFYPVPWHEPVRYAQRVLVAFPLAALALALPVASDMFFVTPALLLPACAAGLLLGVPLARAMHRTLRAEPAAPFLATWALVTFLVRANAPMGDRLLFVPSIGVAGLFALFVARAPRPSWRGLRRDPLVRWSLLVVLGAGLLSAGDLLMRGLSFRAIAEESRSVIATADVGPPSLGRRDVLLLQSPNSMAALTPQATWAVERPDDPDVRMWALQLGRRGMTLEREDRHTLFVRSLGDPFLTEPFERVFVSSDEPPAVGERWHAGAFDVLAAEVEGRGLRALRLVFERSLDDPALRLLVQERDPGEPGDFGGIGRAHLVRLVPPATGETIEVAPAEPLIPFAP